MITNFHNKKTPKEKSPCKCLSIIMLDSVIKANKKYYPQTFLEEYMKKKWELYWWRFRKKVNQIVTLMMKQNLILIMMNMTNNLLKVF